MLALYLTHPQVRLDPMTPVPDWGLSDVGKARVDALGSAPWLCKVARVIASSETKARQTAAVLALGCGQRVEVRPELGENDRRSTGYLPPVAFEAATDRFFGDPDASYCGWETARAAQTRIVAGVDAALDGHPSDTPVLFVGHGAVGTLLSLALRGRAISRGEHQPAGGGNIFAFRLADRQVLCPWTPMERWSWPK